MALGPFMTLGEIRREVLDRLGFPALDSLSLGEHAKLDSMIRSAAKQLFRQAGSIAARKQETITLIEDQATYDFPDGSSVATIHGIWITDSNDRHWPLEPGVTLPERETARGDSARPVLYEITGGNLVLLPAPSDLYVSLTIDFTPELGPMREDGDPVGIDGELVVMKTRLNWKLDQGLPASNEEKAELDQYLRDIVAANSDGRDIVLGGRRSRLTNDRPYNRMSNGRYGYTSADDYNPPGY